MNIAEIGNSSEITKYLKIFTGINIATSVFLFGYTIKTLYRVTHPVILLTESPRMKRESENNYITDNNY
ncbi:MAG: hypothetical protein AABX84_00355 [Nanoarchaeota archaeon]